MNFLKWYSIVFVTLSTFMVLVEWIVSDYEDFVAFVAVILWVPIIVFLVRTVKIDFKALK